jgi:hypothetical protein
MTEEDREYEEERRASENEAASCCQGRNINCGHHYGITS